MKKNILAILFITLLVYSCSNDLDIAADWKEIPVIYGILNPVDSMHYILIYKAFLDEKTNALTLAQNEDSLYYTDSIRAYLKAGSQEIVLQKTDLGAQGLVKDDGIFLSNPNYVYAFSDTLLSDKVYEFHFENLKTGKTATASTPIVKDFTISRPLDVFPINLTAPSFDVDWESAVNGKVYQLIVRFYYEEWNISTPADIDTFSVDWHIFGEEVSATTLGSEGMNYKVHGEEFYSLLHSRLEANPDIQRRAIDAPLSFLFYVGGEDLYNYIRINRAQTGITQLSVKPEYTNIEGGLGLFSSRYYKTRSGIMLSNRSLDSLSCGSVTQDLNFVNAPCN